MESQANVESNACEVGSNQLNDQEVHLGKLYPNALPHDGSAARHRVSGHADQDRLSRMHDTLITNASTTLSVPLLSSGSFTESSTTGLPLPRFALQKRLATVKIVTP